LPAVDLGLADPFAQRLRGADAQLLRDRTDRRVLEVVVRRTSATIRTAR
jgi:hypothetical protein